MFRLAIDLSRIFSFVASVPLKESSPAPKLPSVYGEGPGVGAIGAQFEGVAAALYQKARAKGLGTEIPTDWFLQDIRD